MAREVEFFPAGGGLNEVTPAIAIPPGQFVSGFNFEPWINGGYRRILGYERFDGRRAPSSAEYTAFELGAIGALVVGSVLTGDTSGASGVITGISGLEVGVQITNGLEFVLGETVNTGLTNIATDPILGGASTFENDRAFLKGAEDYWRSFIGVVPGSGPVRGAWRIRERAYALRDNAGATAGVLHKATATGWDASPITMGEIVQFDAGSVELVEGDAINQASGVTADVHRVVLWSGSWGNNDARGYLVLTNVANGSFVDDEAIRKAAVTHALADGTNSTFSLNAGGRCTWVSYNFLGGSSTYRAYCATGANEAFEVDENDIVSPIILDSADPDAPTAFPYLVEAHKGYLWLGFPGGYYSNSVIGEPLVWNGFLGAAQFGVGEEITSMISLSGDVMAVQTRRQSFALFPGQNLGDWERRLIADRAGAILYSAQQIGRLYCVDDAGVVDLARVEAFGDFANATVSDLVQPTITGRRDDIVGSFVVRDSNQYRIQYANGQGMIARVRPDGILEYGPYDYQRDIFCCHSCEDENGDTVIYFGGDDGYVYQAEKGRNFDGDSLFSFVRMAFNHSKSPAYRKRYRRLEIEIDSQAEVTLTVTYDLDYGSQLVGQGISLVDAGSGEVTIFGGGGAFDEGSFEQIYFDAPIVTRGELSMTGTGTNVSIVIYNDSDTTDPFILQGFLLHFDVRRVQR